MDIIEEIEMIKYKYIPKGVKIRPNANFCKNPYAFSLGECMKCEICGRRFDKETGKLIKDSNGLE